MFGWLIRASARASCMNRVRTAWFSRYLRFSVLIATFRPSRSSKPSRTRPMPPPQFPPGPCGQRGYQVALLPLPALTRARRREKNRPSHSVIRAKAAVPSPAPEWPCRTHRCPRYLRATSDPHMPPALPQWRALSPKFSPPRPPWPPDLFLGFPCSWLSSRRFQLAKALQPAVQQERNAFSRFSHALGDLFRCQPFKLRQHDHFPVFRWKRIQLLKQDLHRLFARKQSAGRFRIHRL